MYSIHANWEDEKWYFVTQSVYSDKKLEEDPDLGIPMMNYAYPIEHFDGNESIIKKVNEQTACCIVYDTEEEEYYLALTGGGMDLSQDIAKAYMIVQGFIEWDLLDEVYLYSPLSVSKFWYKKILREAKRQYKINRDRAITKLEQIEGYLAKIKEEK